MADKKVKEDSKVRKVFGVIITIIKVICIIFLILLVIVLGIQRFSNNEIAVGGYRMFTVVTGSMVPVYNIGDVLLIKEVDTNTLEVGDDVTYLGNSGSFNNRVVTHRIIDIDESNGERLFTTQGVANDASDPTISGNQIYGKVLGNVWLLTWITGLMSDMKVFFIVVMIPLALLIFLQIKENIDAKYDKDEDDEDEE